MAAVVVRDQSLEDIRVETPLDVKCALTLSSSLDFFLVDNVRDEAHFQ